MRQPSPKRKRYAAMSDGCKHENFRADVSVNRFDNGPPYMAEVHIKCADCGLPFEFLGLECGVDTHGAKVSVDGQEARLAIIPKGLQPSPLQRMAFSVRKFDG